VNISADGLKIVTVLLLALFPACGGGEGDNDMGADSHAADVNDTQGEFTDTRDVIEKEDRLHWDARDAGGTDSSSDIPGKFPLPISLACEGESECHTACGNGTCVDGICHVSPLQGYCIAMDGAWDAICYKDGQHSAEHGCLFCNRKIESERLTPFVMKEGFEVLPLIYTPIVEDLTGGGVTWSVSARRAYWGEASLYFGDPETGTYANDMHVAARARFMDLKVPPVSNPRIDFFLFLETEETEGYDVFSVRVASGDYVEEVFNSDSILGDTTGVFEAVSADISGFAGETVELSFYFDSVDGGINSYEGAYIDGIRLTTGCCADTEDCDDGDPCSDDTCPGIGETCLNQALSGCCVNDWDCDDSDLCTWDSCPYLGQECLFDPIPGCCHVDEDCDDGDECTLDSCPKEGGLCLHLPYCCTDSGDCKSPDWCLEGECVDGYCGYVDLCCHSNEDCDDKDPCTVDVCEDGDCTHALASIPGCCWPDLMMADFDGGNDGFSMDPPMGGVGWSVVTQGKSTSAPGALYYGNPAEKNFDNGAINSGAATSATVSLPAGFGASLSFQVYMDTESSPSYDQLRVFWQESGSQWPLWSKGYELSQKSFEMIKADVSAFAGRSGRLAFEFKTIDALTNYGEGVYVDDVTVTSTCQPVYCSKDSDCDDGLSFSDGTCSGGMCVWDLPESVDCLKDSDCDDGDWCTFDYCIGGICEYEIDPWCWM